MAKKGRGKNKGNAFEREIVKRLSLWWTEGERDDVFWRSQTSGGRATQRFKKQQLTEGQYGDITAAHPDGKPLTDLITFELKRGYSTLNIHSLLDELPHHGITRWDEWVSGLMESRKQSGVPHWAIIHKRDGRNAIIWLPKPFAVLLPERVREAIPLLRVRRHFWRDHNTSYLVELVGIAFDDFLEFVSCKDILRIGKRCLKK